MFLACARPVGCYFGGMSLPLKTAYAPMDALLVDEIPVGDQWQYEPKWDGFRCLAFREKQKVEMESKSGQGLGRYFPELMAALAELGASCFVLDGEIVVPEDQSISFDALLQRIHPAASRIKKLSVETPAVLILFDLLVDEKGESLADVPLKARRAKLEAFAKKHLKKNPRIVLSPATTDMQQAREWYEGVKGGGALGWGGGQAFGHGVPVGLADGDGESEADADGRLRGGRVSILDGWEGAGVAVAGAV